MDCYIVCNMFPPLVSDVVRAPGLRAEQLAHQARPHFDRVRYVMPVSRYDMLTGGNQVAHGVRAHPDFLVLHDLYFEFFVNRIEPSCLVFTQVEFPELLNLASKRHHVVYDLLAPKALELECGGAPRQEVERARNNQWFCVSRAHRVLVNGDKNRALFATDLAGHPSVVVNPFCPVAQEGAVQGRRDRIVFFSSAQKWTDNTAFLAAMAETLETMPDIPAIFLSPMKHHEHRESPAISCLSQMSNVRRHTALSYPALLAVFDRAAAVMDWSGTNAERENSTSTRLIQAVSRGAAIFGNAGTGLDRFWDGYPGETSDGPPGPDRLAAFIRKARSDGFADAVSRAGDWNDSVLSNGDVFGGIA